MTGWCCIKYNQIIGFVIQKISKSVKRCYFHSTSTIKLLFNGFEHRIVKYGSQGFKHPLLVGIGNSLSIHLNNIQVIKNPGWFDTNIALEYIPKVSCRISRY